MRKCALEDNVSWLANKKTEQLYQVTPCLDHKFKKAELETDGDLSNVGAHRLY